MSRLISEGVTRISTLGEALQSYSPLSIICLPEESDTVELENGVRIGNTTPITAKLQAVIDHVQEWMHSCKLVELLRDAVVQELQEFRVEGQQVQQLQNETYLRIKRGLNEFSRTIKHADYFFYRKSTNVHKELIGPLRFDPFPVECRQNVCKVCLLDLELFYSQESVNKNGQGISCNWCQWTFHPSCLGMDALKECESRRMSPRWHCPTCTSRSDVNLVTCWVPLQWTSGCSLLHFVPCSHELVSWGSKNAQESQLPDDYVPDDYVPDDHVPDSDSISSLPATISPVMFQSKVIHWAGPQNVHSVNKLKDACCRISIDVRFAIKPSELNLWRQYIDVQPVAEILFCVERMHQVLLSLHAGATKQKNGKRKRRGATEVFLSDAENIVFLTAVLLLNFPCAPVSTESPVAGALLADAAKYICTAVRQMIWLLVNSCSDFDASARVRWACRAAGCLSEWETAVNFDKVSIVDPAEVAVCGSSDPQSQSFQNKKNKKKKRKTDNEQRLGTRFECCSGEMTLKMTLDWIEYTAFHGADGATLNIVTDYQGAVAAILAKPLGRVTESDLYLVTHFVLCLYNWGGTTSGVSVLSLTTVCELRAWLFRICDQRGPISIAQRAQATYVPLGFEPWIEALLCFELLLPPTSTVFHASLEAPEVPQVKDKWHAHICQHITPALVCKRLHTPVAMIKESPYLQLVEKTAHRSRHAKHIDYHTHFLVAAYWCRHMHSDRFIYAN